MSTILIMPQPQTVVHHHTYVVDGVTHYIQVVYDEESRLDAHYLGTGPNGRTRR